MIDRNKYYILIFFLCGLTGLYAQDNEKDKNLPEGNEAFAEKKYDDAEAEYRISESKFKKKSIASYNLGNAVYRQNQASEAKYHYADAIKNAKTRPEKHQAYHNIGNAFMKEKDYSNAVEAYKNALRNNPADEETRYNLALAKKLLEQNPPKSKDDKKKGNNPDNKDEKKEKEKEKDENQNNKPQQDKKDDSNQNQGKPKPQPGDLSKQRLENLLDAINNEEKKIQEKVNKQKVLSNPDKPEKDW